MREHATSNYKLSRGLPICPPACYGASPDERESRQSKRRLERDVYKNILIALDESQAAERALHRAMAMPEIEKGDLFVVVVNEGVPLFASIVWGVQETSRN